MNHIKIQTEILKNTLNKKENNWKVTYDEGENVVYLVDPANAMIVKVSGDDFILDIELLEKWGVGSISLETIRNIFGGGGYLPADLTGDISTNLPGVKANAQAQKVKNENAELWVDRKYIAFFEKDCSFEIMRDKTPVRVIENGEIAGVIMPINR